MIDINELRRLAQAVSGWSSCNQAWLDQSEDVPAAVVGHIDEDGNTYPVATIDCDQYYAADQSLPLGKFYAAANPATVIELLDRLEAAENAVTEAYQRGYATGQEEIEKERDALRAEIERMKQQEPYCWTTSPPSGRFSRFKPEVDQWISNGWETVPLCLAPGAQPAPSAPEGWLRAIDEALVVAHVGVANADDTYEQAKAKLDNLIGFHFDLAMIADAPEAKP